MKRKILITLGTGGVGKTTLSAALALKSAQMGSRTLVITIDPAKRLAQTLGLDALGSEPTLIAEALTQGKLSALTFDSDQALEELLTELSPSAEFRQRLQQNLLFRTLIRQYSGVNEYLALQKLLSVYESWKFDRIVLDTPPDQSALHFLDAPQLLSRLYRAQFIDWIVKPAGKLASILEMMTGSGFISALADFARAIVEIRPGFEKKLKTIEGLFRSQETGMILVTQPRPSSVQNLFDLSEQLKVREYSWDAILLNRSLGYFPASEFVNLSSARDLLKALWEQEQEVCLQIENRSGHVPMVKIPELLRDVHRIEDLTYVAEKLESLLS